MPRGRGSIERLLPPPEVRRSGVSAGYGGVARARTVQTREGVIPRQIRRAFVRERKLLSQNAKTHAQSTAAVWGGVFELYRRRWHRVDQAQGGAALLSGQILGNRQPQVGERFRGVGGPAQGL